ncbi:hypothetical protein [Clostridium saccharoperbutylacetonicum]
MIIVNCALRQDDIVKIVEDITHDGINIFKCVAKEDLRLFFKCNFFLNKEKAKKIAHDAIINTNIGRTLFFNVVDINEYPWVKYPYY